MLKNKSLVEIAFWGFLAWALMVKVGTYFLGIGIDEVIKKLFGG